MIHQDLEFVHNSRKFAEGFKFESSQFCELFKLRRLQKLKKKTQLVLTLLRKCQNKVGFFSNYVVFSENLNFKAQAKAVKSQAEAKTHQLKFFQ